MLVRRLAGVGGAAFVALVVGALPAGAATGEAQAVGRAVADAGTGLAVVRVLPGGGQAATEVGFGLASASADSEAQSFERAVAQAAPGGISVQGNSPQVPGSLAQTAPPDNAEPATTGLSIPRTPLDALVAGGALRGSVHARWSDALGPCVGTVADASTELASLSVLSAIPTLPNVLDLAGLLDAPGLDAAGDQAVVDGLKQLAGPLRTLGGVLSGAGNMQATGSVLSLPNAMSVRSTVELVDLPGSANKAVRSTSTMQAVKLSLLAGTPFQVDINVVSQPTLQVTSTGEQSTSTVNYTAPVLEVVQGGRSLGRLDAAHPTLDIPIGIPLPGASGVGDLPIIGGLLGNGQALTDAIKKLDLGVFRLGIAQLNQQSQQLTQPFPGFQLGATARLLDLQILPTAALGLANLPSALAQVSLGEQVARAYAPTGGVVCGPPASQPAQPPTPMPQGKVPPKLAYTTAQYKTIPMFWTGTAMLMIGVIVVAALPRRPELATESPPDPEAEPEPEPETDLPPASADVKPTSPEDP